MTFGRRPPEDCIGLPWEVSGFASLVLSEGWQVLIQALNGTSDFLLKNSSSQSGDAAAGREQDEAQTEATPKTALARLGVEGDCPSRGWEELIPFGGTEWQWTSSCLQVPS